MQDETSSTPPAILPYVKLGSEKEGKPSLRLRGLFRWIVRNLDESEPRLPVTEEGRKRLCDFRDLLVERRSFEHVPIKPHEITMMIDPARWFDPIAPRCGQRLLAFLQLVAQEVMTDDEGSDYGSEDPVDFWMLIDTGFSLVPHLLAVLKVRKTSRHRIITATREGERLIGAAMHVKLPLRRYR